MPLLVLDVLPAQVKGEQRRIECKDFRYDLGASLTKVAASKTVLLVRRVICRLLQEDEHLACDTLALLLLLSLLLGIFKGCLVTASLHANRPVAFAGGAAAVPPRAPQQRVPHMRRQVCGWSAVCGWGGLWWMGGG